MKKITQIITILALLATGVFKAQEIKEWSKLKPEQRKDLINKMTPEERMNLLKNFRENMVVEELDIPEDKQEEFRTLYNEYQESQKEIKSRFVPKENYQNMSDKDAKKELEKSFEVGQQLLENRRKYSERFQRLMKPQQVLRLFQNEGMMRNKVMDRQRELRTNQGTSPFRNNSGSQSRGQRRSP